MDRWNAGIASSIPLNIAPVSMPLLQPIKMVFRPTRIWQQSRKTGLWYILREL
jgi:hypothetical protein